MPPQNDNTVMGGLVAGSACPKGAAYTQTYSTTTRTHSTPTGAALTDNTGGAADATLAAVEAVYTQATIRNNFADLAAQVNNLVTDIANIKQLLNAVIDDLQAVGLVG